ncbi:MAG: hypothetical protein A4E72_00592 [Syntrophus sp. PtaU1.Bin208]|nr:MAG: hypothetical protein A4E72_00592 [Syntrophus sp. PtaU1.Bin208]
MGEQGVEGVDESGGGSPVFLEGVGDVRLLRRRHVGKDVRPPEAVNRLLWIADEKDRGPLPFVLRTLKKNGSQDFVLHGIGILELIDQRSPVFSPNGSRQIIARAFPEGFPQTKEQVFKEEDVPAGLMDG